MRITNKLKRDIQSSFENYLISKSINFENIFLFFSPETFKTFLSKFEPDITEYSSVGDICRFLNEKQIGTSVVVAWNPKGQKIGKGLNYVFSPCKLIVEKDSKEEICTLVVCGWNEKFLLMEK